MRETFAVAFKHAKALLNYETYNQFKYGEATIQMLGPDGVEKWAKWIRPPPL